MGIGRRVIPGLASLASAGCLLVLTALPASAAGYTVSWYVRLSYPSSFAYAYKSANCSGPSVTLSNGADHNAFQVRSTMSPSYYTEFTKDGASKPTAIAQGKCFKVKGTGVLQGFDPR